jgi:hypothetical protein
MKTIKKLILLTIAICLLTYGYTKSHKSHNSNKSKSHHKHKKYTPKAIDLNNHFGGPQIGSPYGPSASYDDYVERNPEIFTPQRYSAYKDIQNSLEFKPYPGWENKLNPHPIKSGDFTNVAPSATRIISPDIAKPKLHIQTELEYPSHVKIPTFYGFRKQMVPVHAYDKLEGKIIQDNVIINAPQYGYEDRVLYIF